jgi:hypothetical protein
MVTERTDLGLAASKRLSDALLDGESPTVTVPTVKAERSLVTEAERLGADAAIESGSG